MRNRWYQWRCQDLVQGARNEASTAKRRRPRDRNHWHTYGRPIRSWPLNFPHIFFERNVNGQHGHFTKIHSISKFNLPFLNRKLDVRFICVEIGIYLKNVLYISKFNTKIYKNSSTSDSVLRPLPGLCRCTAPTGDFRTQNPTTTLPLVLGVMSAHDQSADGVETKENGNGVSHSTVDQRI